jgi:DNA helicase-2/ATP-dependent DNA helicase PcrA
VGVLAARRRFAPRARARGPVRYSDFFAAMNQNRDKDEGDDDDAARGKVTLSTLHSAKGLEWPLVLLIGCEEGTMPHKRVSAPRISDAIAGDVEEERRLFYVGITRARDRLYLTRAATRSERGADVPRRPSRFLDDLPEADVQVYDIAREERLSAGDVASMADAFLARLAGN